MYSCGQYLPAGTGSHLAHCWGLVSSTTSRANRTYLCATSSKIGTLTQVFFDSGKPRAESPELYLCMDHQADCYTDIESYADAQILVASGAEITELRRPDHVCVTYLNVDMEGGR